mmetsp:Transcript_80916/g.187930  ORF Transcript_80916/g.187930 Transcript_80916/m.187930 type:complete len:127 (+) Transcript_80916:66-446(+)
MGNLILLLLHAQLPRDTNKLDPREEPASWLPEASHTGAFAHRKMRCQSAPKTAALMAAQTSSGLTVAEWAQTAASQPAVNAHHVEAVQAWECPQEFALGESVHTDSARVRCALLQAERCHHGSVNE